MYKHLKLLNNFRFMHLPQIIDKMPRVTLKELRLAGFFKGWQTLKIYSFGMEISINGYLDDMEDARIKLEWNTCGELKQQYIPLIRVATNLGMDYFRWFMTDLDHNIKYSKAYFDGTIFRPRIELKNAFYEVQLQSKEMRDFSKVFLDPLLRSEKAKRMLTKWSKKHYRGKPTPRMRKVLKYLEIAPRQ